MTIDETIYTRLSGFAGLSALVSNRISPVILGDNPTLPAVAYEIESRPDQAMDTTAGMSGTLRVYSWADSFNGARAVAEQVYAALNRWGGIQSCLATTIGAPEAVEITADRWNWAVQTEFSIRYTA